MTKLPAAPKQISMFDIDSPLHGKMRGERSIMDFPFFVLSKQRHMEPIEYRQEGRTIEIRPSATGVATMYDKEILLYAASLIAQMIEDGLDVEQDVIFTAHDFFRVTGVARPSKRDYARFGDAFERLQGTQIKTNIETGSKIERGWFSWLSEAQAEYEKLPSGEERLKYVRLRMCNWLFRAIQRDRRIYHYHHDYFRLGTVERRLYEIAHCYCGDGEVRIELEALQRKVGSTASARKFKQTLKLVEIENRLPEYEICLDETGTETRTDTIGRRKSTVQTFVTMKPKAQQIKRMRRLAA